MPIWLTHCGLKCIFFCSSWDIRVELLKGAIFIEGAYFATTGLRTQGVNKDSYLILEELPAECVCVLSLLQIHFWH